MIKVITLQAETIIAIGFVVLVAIFRLIFAIAIAIANTNNRKRK